jgi:hypothetical protein
LPEKIKQIDRFSSPFRLKLAEGGLLDETPPGSFLGRGPDENELFVVMLFNSLEQSGTRQDGRQSGREDL